MVGKILITKSLLSSQVTYILSYLLSLLTLPEHVIKDSNKTLFQYVWGGSEKVKRKTIINSYECGGLKMLHLPAFLDSLKWSWLKELQTQTQRTGRTFHFLKYKKLNLVLTY